MILLEHLRILGSIISIVLLASCGEPVQNNDEGIAPISRVEIGIEPEQQEILHTLLYQFAERNRMEGKVEARTGDGHYIIRFWRDGLELVGSNSVDRNVYKFGFYQRKLNQPVFCKEVEGLLSDLNRAVYTRFDGSVSFDPLSLDRKKCK